MFDPQPVHIDTQQLKNIGTDFMRHLLRKKGILFLFVVIALVVAGSWVLLRKPQYKAVSTFVLEEKSSGGGGIAGLASQFGIDLGSMSSGANGFFTGENIDDILTSTTVMEKVLLSPMDSSTHKTVLLADRYLDASGMRESMTWKDLLRDFSFGEQYPSRQEKPLGIQAERFRDSVLYAVMDRITKKDLLVERSNKKGTIFQVQMNSRDPLFAGLFTQRLVDVTSSMYVDIKTRNITDNIKKLEARAASLRSTFESSSYRSYETQVFDANEAFSSIKATGEVKQRDKSVAFELYAEVTKNLELSRMLLINQTPVIQVLDRPRETLPDSNMASWKLFSIALLAAFLLTVLMALISFKPKN